MSDVITPTPAIVGLDRHVKGLLLRLMGVEALDTIDSALIQSLLDPVFPHRLGADLGDDGDGSCRFLVSGWACRLRDSPWGGRQILDFVLPGDPIGLSVGGEGGGQYRVIALTRGTTVNAKALRDHIRSGPVDGQMERLRAACLRSERVRATRLHDHTVRLGAPTTTQGMIHLLLDFRARMAEIGELRDGTFPMPLSQEVLSQALGVTVTQVYRILVQLRKDGLIVIGSGSLTISDPAALANAARYGSAR